MRFAYSKLKIIIILLQIIVLFYSVLHPMVVETWGGGNLFPFENLD